MPIINPFDLNTENLTDAINNVLEDQGINPIAPVKKTNHDLDDVRKIFTDAGAGIEDIASTVASVMSNNLLPSAKLSAAKLALEVQGILSQMDSKPAQSIIININGSENKTLINLVLPN